MSQSFIDCLATGEWKEYKPRHAGPHLPFDCPPIFLKCDNQPGHGARPLGEPGQWGPSPVTGPGQWEPTTSVAMLPRGAFDDAYAPVPPGGMGDDGAVPASEVPHHVHQGLRRLTFAFGKAHQQGKAMFLQSPNPAFRLGPPMPKDPMAECQVVSEAVERFHQIHLLAPTLLPQLQIFLLLRMVLLLPLVVLGCLGFCWGKDLYERVDQGYNPVAISQHVQPQVMLNPALGISVAPQMSMAQPLMLSAPPVPPPQVTAITPPS